jgi:hypothetical protein
MSSQRAGGDEVTSEGTILNETTVQLLRLSVTILGDERTFPEAGTRKPQAYYD